MFPHVLTHPILQLVTVFWGGGPPPPPPRARAGRGGGGGGGGAGGGGGGGPVTGGGAVTGEGRSEKWKERCRDQILKLETVVQYSRLTDLCWT